MKTIERVDVDLAEVAREMARLAEEEGLKELTVEVGKRSLRVRRAATGWGMPVSTELPPDEEPSEEEVALATGVPVTSEVVGIYRSLEKTKPGARVKKDQVVGSIESVSLKHELRSPAEGEVAELLVSDGEPVQYGQVVLVVRADV
jgi:biotin carboxyl carrier protein